MTRMKHRIYVYARKRLGRPGWLWYTHCMTCDWEPGRRTTWPDGTATFGRPAWHLAYGLGLGHLRREA